MMRFVALRAGPGIIDICRSADVFSLMEPGAKIALIVGLFSSSFILNVPMGFLRSYTRKFTLSWFLCVHATIPVIYFGRIFSHLDIRYVPIFITAAVLGQIMGGKTGL